MNNSDKTKLERKFAFWYRISDDALLHSKTLDKKEYETQVKKIADFETVYFVIFIYFTLNIFY
jgi:hypothetical protein